MKKRILSFIFVLIWVCVPAFSKLKIDLSKLKRVDPHGTEDMSLEAVHIKKQKKCKTCHFIQKNLFLKKDDLKLKPNMEKRCVSCHSQAPHSGVLEHMGKNLSKLGIGLQGELYCGSCHRAHRAYLPKEVKAVLEQKSTNDKKGLEGISGAPEYLTVKKESKKLPDTVEERHTPHAMILRTCKDCHKW